MSYGTNFPDLFQRATELPTKYCTERSPAISRSKKDYPNSVSSRLFAAGLFGFLIFNQVLLFSER